jgi:hypothetical protein
MNHLFVCGYFESRTVFGNDTVYVQNDPNPREVYIARFDTSGVPVWVTQSVSSHTGVGQIDALAVTTDLAGKVYMTGVVSDNIMFGSMPLNGAANGTNVYIAQFEPGAGACQFTIESTGANPGAFGYGITADNQGGIYITGLTSGAAVFGPYSTSPGGSDDLFIAKLDVLNGISPVTENEGSLVSFFASSNLFELHLAGKIFFPGSRYCVSTMEPGESCEP